MRLNKVLGGRSRPVSGYELSGIVREQVREDFAPEIDRQCLTEILHLYKA